MKKYPVHVIDMTTRLGVHAVELLGIKNFSDSGYWHELSSSQFPASYVVNWQHVGAGDELRPIQRDTAGIAVLIGPGCVDRLRDVLRWLPGGGCPVWLLTAPSAIVEEIMFRTTTLAANHIHYRLPTSDPKTLWFVMMEMFVKAIEAARAADPDFLSPERKEGMPSNLKHSIDQAMTIDGALAVALVDHRSGMCLAKAGGVFNLDLAAAGNTQVVRAKLATMESLGLQKGGIEDILITLADQYHLIRLIPTNPGLFLYLVLDKTKGNLALARYKLSDIERAIQV